MTVDSLPPTETLELENGLSLVPRIKLILTVHPSLSSSATKPIDEWKLKRALVDFLNTSLSVTVTEDDLQIKRYADLKKRKRDDAVAYGTLCIRDLSSLKKDDVDLKVKEKKFIEWRNKIVEKMDGIELNLEGYKYKLSAAVPEGDDFEGVKKSWEEIYVLGNPRGYSSRGGGRQEPDTIVMRGVPSRWFAEPRVSSKPSALVTHTIFSAFGKIRNLNVMEDDDYVKDGDEDGGDIISGIYCKIVVQFEKYADFYNALKVLCGRSLQKQGSRLKADYEVTWAKDSFFRNSSSQAKEKNDMLPVMAGGRYGNEAPRHERYISQFNSDDTRRKRFKE